MPWEMMVDSSATTARPAASASRTSAEQSGNAVPPYEQNLLAAKQMAKDNPRIVASVVSNWTNGNES